MTATLDTTTWSTAPWSAEVMMREWAVERAGDVVASGAPDANDYREVLATDGDGWDVALLAEMIADVLRDDPTSIDDAWSIGPWWSRRVALIEDVRWSDERAAFGPAPKVTEQTRTIAPRKDGTYRTSRQRSNMAIGGRGKFTADGAPLSPEMAAYGALVPAAGATAQDAWSAAAAMAAHGLIPAAIGGEDWAPREMTPALPGKPHVEFQSEAGAGGTVRLRALSGRSHSLLHEQTCPLKVEAAAARKAKRSPDKSIVCSCDPTYRITERVTGERKADHRRADYVRGVAVLASESSDAWARSHIGDAVTVLAPRATVFARTTELRRDMDKGRKVTRYVGGKAKPAHAAKLPEATRKEGSTIGRTIRGEQRAEILAILASIGTEGATATWNAWTIACEQAATSRTSARFAATDNTGRTVTDTPRALASALAN